MDRGAARGRFQEGQEQATVYQMPFEQEFRVPLQAQEESVRGMFNRLDDSMGAVALAMRTGPTVFTD